MKRIALSRGEYALVDDEDFQRVNQYKWCVSNPGKRKTFYASRSIRIGKRQKCISMHRFILNFPKFNIDHRDTNGLNNCKWNLRQASHSQNGMNRKPQFGCSSKYKGVTWNKLKRRWRVLIMYNGRSMLLGCFKNEIEAAKAYDKKAKELFGEYARLNQEN